MAVYLIASLTYLRSLNNPSRNHSVCSQGNADLKPVRSGQRRAGPSLDEAGMVWPSRTAPYPAWRCVVAAQSRQTWWGFDWPFPYLPGSVSLFKHENRTGQFHPVHIVPRKSESAAFLPVKTQGDAAAVGRALSDKLAVGSEQPTYRCLPP
jgi:hypothetical protein